MTHLEMQRGTTTRARAHIGDVLAGCNAIALFDLSVANIAVGRQIVIIVLDDHQLAETPQTSTTVDHLTRSCSVNRGTGGGVQVHAVARTFGIMIIEHTGSQRPAPTLRIDQW